MKKSWALNTLFILTLAIVALTPFIVTQEFLYPFFMPKALFLRALATLGLPFYIYLLIVDKSLRPNLKNPLNLSLLIFCLVNLVAAIFGVNWMRSFWGNYERMGGVYHLFNLTLVYFYILLLAKEKETYLALFLKILVWVGGITSVYAVLEKIGMTPWVPDEALPARVSSIFGNPIFFSSFIIIPIFLSLFFYFQTEKRNKYWYAAAAVVQTVALLLTATRGALVGLILGLVLGGTFYFLADHKGRKRLALYFGGIILFCAIIFFVGKQMPYGSMLNRLANFQDSNGQARIIQWGIALKGFKDAPVLGVGPENYYIIANKYFDRQLYTFDYSWFDKPHNYWLEILTTSGILGLAAYLSILLFSLQGIFKAFKNGFLGKTEAALLLGALVSYQAQNMFVFDTPSASLALFILLALTGFLSSSSTAEEKTGKTKIHVPSYALPVFIVVGIGVIYLVVVTNVVTALVSRDINYGYSIDIQDPVRTKNYFDSAQKRSFIYDPGEIAVKTEEFTVRAVQDSNKKDDKEFINALFNDAISQLEAVNKKIDNNPIYWFKLGNMYSQKAYYNKAGFDSRAEVAINKSISLVPNRIEPLFFLVQIQALKNNLDEVVKISERINQMVPDNAEATWRLALAYKDGGDKDKAAKTAERAYEMGYRFKLVREFAWLINYYADKEDYAKVRMLYERAIELNPNDYQLYASLATVYAKLGENEKAIAAAHKVLELNPGSKATVDAFLKALGAQ